MTNALHTLADYFDPFYNVGHSFGLDRDTVRAYIAKGGNASLDGRVITVTCTGLPMLAGRTKLGRTRRAAQWVRTFNTKASR